MFDQSLSWRIIIPAIILVLATGFLYWPAMRASFRLHPGLSLNLTFAAAFGLLLFWLIGLDTGVGLRLHFSGLAFVTLLIGPELALLAGMFASAALSFVLGMPLSALPLSVLAGTLLPVLLMHWLIVAERRKQSSNFFVFIMVNGFLGGILTISLMLVLSVLLGFLVGKESWSSDHSLLLQYIPLIALPEGILNGMLITCFLVFKPDWVRTLDENRYDRHAGR